MKYRVRVDESNLAHVVREDGTDWIDDLCSCTGIHAEHNAKVIAKAMELFEVAQDLTEEYCQ